MADAPDRSILPVARPQFPVISAAAPARSITPVARPSPTSGGAATTVAAITPPPRAGSVCNNPAIIGMRIDPIGGALAGCGILNPVRVTAIEQVQLSKPVTIDCPTARAMAEWVREGVKPAIGNLGGGVAVLNVVGSYSCRPRNNQAGAKLSEHGRGRAVDISGFSMFDGQKLTVLKDWSRTKTKRILRTIHATACGPFGTVLGPNSDSYHRDHFHLDTANHRNGNYCR